MWTLKRLGHVGVHLFSSLWLTEELMRQRRNFGPEEMEQVK